MKGAVPWMLIVIISILIAVAVFIIIYSVSGKFAENLFGGLGGLFG